VSRPGSMALNAANGTNAHKIAGDASAVPAAVQAMQMAGEPNLRSQPLVNTVLRKISTCLWRGLSAHRLESMLVMYPAENRFETIRRPSRIRSRLADGCDAPR
jgi:hypothetical protein